MLTKDCRDYKRVTIVDLEASLTAKTNVEIEMDKFAGKLSAYRKRITNVKQSPNLKYELISH